MRKNMQISLFDIHNVISTSIEERKPKLISLLDEPEYQETQTTGIIYISTELLLNVQSISLKIPLV